MPQDRVWASFNHEEPDRVPIYEGAIEPAELNRSKAPVHTDPGILFLPFQVVKLISSPWAEPVRRIVFKALSHPAGLVPLVKPAFYQYSKVHRQLGIDLIGFAGGFPAIFHPRLFNHLQAAGSTLYGPKGDVALRLAKGGGAVSREGVLRDEADYDRYVQLDPDNPSNYFMVHPAISAAMGKIALVFSIYGSAFFENLCDLFGYTALFKLLVKAPGFIDRVVKDMSTYAIATLEEHAARGVRLVYMTDDLGQIGRSLISPRMYDRFFTAGIKRFCDRAHRLGVKVMRHSDGYVQDLVPRFIGEGVDALHPWESDAGMDIFAAKREWGDRLVLVGNVPIRLLTNGSPRDVVHYTRELCSACAPGGGFILSSSHSVVQTCKWQNYMAMLWAARIFST